MTYLKNLGIPYMGNKRKLAPKILDYILSHNPNCKYFYDLFGGGGSISFEALQRPQIKQVLYNEYNAGVVNLLKKIKTDGVSKEFYNWVSREEFNDLKNGDDWKAGLIKTCWSFGNNQNGYLFSEENEELKRPLHEIVVNKCLESAELFKNKYGLEIPLELINIEGTINQRRLKIMEFVKKSFKDFELLQLQGLLQVERLEQLQKLEISNKSYSDVEIKTPVSETIIYLDPPYFKTAKYQFGINETDFMEFVKSSPYKIYVSSYDLDLPCVLEMDHRCKLSATANNKVIERLFCNKEEATIEDKEPFLFGDF